MDDASFLNWVADRFVHVHGAEAGMDYVLRLRSMANAARPEGWKPALVMAIERAANICAREMSKQVDEDLVAAVKMHQPLNWRQAFIDGFEKNR